MNKTIEKICISENQRLSKFGLSEHSFGNVSIRFNKILFYIKPSGIDVKKLKLGNCPLIDINSGKVVNNSKFKPSVDTPTHLEIYKKFDSIKSISHCHSLFATAWAQSSKPIPLLGTTHADFWRNEIPIVKYLKKKQMTKYELNTGKVICKKIINNNIDVKTCPGILVSGHAQFSWGTTYKKAVNNSNLIEYVAELAFLSLNIGVKKKIPSHISNFHFDRKNSKKKYYGQK